MAEVAQAKSDLQFLWKGLDNCPAPFSYIQSILRYCRIDVLRPSVHACRQVPHASKSLPQKEVCNLTGSIPRTANDNDISISVQLSMPARKFVHGDVHNIRQDTHFKFVAFPHVQKDRWIRTFKLAAKF